jgi:uncharacterized protein YndB with AHSA1/START domain
MSTLTLQRTLAAPPERVWHALTDPTALAAWFWPDSLRTVATLDPRPGGGYSIAAPARMAVRGEYRVVEPPRRLEFSWQWEGETERTIVRLELSTVDDPEHAGGPAATALRLTHDLFPDELSRDNHIQGWTDCLDRLPGFLATPLADVDLDAAAG